MIKEIHTENAPAAIGPYSQAIQAGDFIYVSGQIGVDPVSGVLFKELWIVLRITTTFCRECKFPYKRL